MAKRLCSTCGEAIQRLNAADEAKQIRLARYTLIESYGRSAPTTTRRPQAYVEVLATLCIKTFSAPSSERSSHHFHFIYF